MSSERARCGRNPRHTAGVSGGGRKVAAVCCSPPFLLLHMRPCHRTLPPDIKTIETGGVIMFRELVGEVIRKTFEEKVRKTVMELIEELNEVSEEQNDMSYYILIVTNIDEADKSKSDIFNEIAAENIVKHYIVELHCRCNKWEWHLHEIDYIKTIKVVI